MNDVYKPPVELEIPAACRRPSHANDDDDMSGSEESSLPRSSGRTSPNNALSDSEADFVQQAGNLALKAEEVGGFETAVVDRHVSVGGEEDHAMTPPASQRDSPSISTDNGEKSGGGGILGQMFRRTAPKAQALKERAMRSQLAEMAANRMDHGQQLLAASKDKKRSGGSASQEDPSMTAAKQQAKNQATLVEVCEQVLAGQGVGVVSGLFKTHFSKSI